MLRERQGADLRKRKLTCAKPSSVEKDVQGSALARRGLKPLWYLIRSLGVALPSVHVRKREQHTNGQETSMCRNILQGDFSQLTSFFIATYIDYFPKKRSEADGGVSGFLTEAWIGLSKIDKSRKSSMSDVV